MAAALAAVATLTGLATAGKALGRPHPKPTPDAPPVPPARVPEHPYNQRHYEKARRQEAEMQRQNFLRTHGGNVVSNNVKRLDTQHRGPYYSELAGAALPDGFSHSNMQPFLGARSTQDVRLDRDPRHLETFTGGNLYHRDKDAVPALFEPVPGMTNIGGMPSSTQFEQGRMNDQGAVVQRHNELPFEQVRVGKGVGLGYTAEPAGGLNQSPGLDVVPMYKTVDELRVASKPKTTYSLPTHAGAAAGAMERGVLPNLVQNRAPPLVRAQCADDLLPSAAPGTQVHATRPEVIARDTGRGVDADGYFPPAGPAPGGAHNWTTTQHDAPRRRADGLAVPGPSNGRAPHAPGLCDDYGADTLELGPTSREFFVEAPSRLGALTSAVKALIAPLTDALRITRKDEAALGHRDFGSLQVQAPPKLTLPGTAPLPTVKDTLLHDSTRLNPSGPKRPTVVDVTQVARVTLRETLVHDTHSGNFGNGPRCVAVYDASATRVTGRQTLPEQDIAVNVRPHDRGAIRSNDQTARVTVRETTLLEDYVGAVGVRNGAYDPSQARAPPVTRRELGDAQVGRFGAGAAARNAEGAYTQTEFDMPMTGRELDPGGARYGGAGPGATPCAPASHEAFEAARFDGARELTLERTDPGSAPSGPKVAVGVEAVNAECRREHVEAGRAAALDRVAQRTVGPEALTLTATGRQSYAEHDRICAEVVEQVRANPYALPPRHAAPAASGAAQL